MAVIDNLHIYSTKDRLLSISTVDVGGIAIQVVSPQMLLLYFLFEAHRSTGDTRILMTKYYLWTLAMINAAAATKVKDLAKFVSASPFFPSVQTLGDVNHDSAYMIKMASTVKEVGGTPPESLHLDASIKTILTGLPQNYYPSDGKKRPTPFEYGSALFRRAGEKTP
jgi:hypothetical protein